MACFSFSGNAGKNIGYTLFLIVPCYNEAQTIEACIEKVLEISSGQDFSLEVVIVDDASALITGCIDFTLTRLLITITPFFTLHWTGTKSIASIIGFIGNFALRKILVFPKKKKGKI